MASMKFEKDELLGIVISIVVATGFFAALRFDFIPDFSSFAKTEDAAPAEEEIIYLKDGESIMSLVASAMSSKGRVEKLIVEDTLVGQGDEAMVGSRVTVHYIGMLQNGTEFDNSFKKGTPYTFMVGNEEVIKGWDLGVVGMREGGERILVIPPHLAYGDRSSGPIAANSTLLFAVELISVE